MKNLPVDFCEPIQFGIDHEVAEIDEYRSEQLEHMRYKVESLESERKAWLAGHAVIAKRLWKREGTTL